jgi:hypothetical protein
MQHALIDATRCRLPAEIITRTRTSLLRIADAVRRAEFLVAHLRGLARIEEAVERNLAGSPAPQPALISSKTIAAAAADATALDLLSLPPDRWRAVLAAAAPRQQRAALRRVVAIADSYARTAPDRAHQIADVVLALVRCDRLPICAPLLRRQLAGRALLARARALVTMRAYADALPVIAGAHQAFPRTIAYARYRILAQLLHAEALAATGDAASALGTLLVCAHRAIDHIEPSALVDALATLAVILCAHAEHGVARSALSLASHVASQPGNEASIVTLRNALTECAFLGYAAESGVVD